MPSRFSNAWRQLALPLFAVLWSVWFFRMMRYGLHSWFSQDDLQNLYYAWSKPLGRGHHRRLLTEAVIYGIYRIFGFNPAPFNVFRLALCLANTAVLYWVVSRITRSRESGVLAVLLTGFHPAFRDIYYDSGMLFDALAFFFYYAALTLYIGGRRTVWVLLVFLAALNSKEIAVTFPLAILLFEIVVNRQRRFLAPAFAGLLTVIFIAATVTGPEALSALPAYRPQISLSNYLNNYAHYAGDFVFESGRITGFEIALALVACIGVALALKDSVLLWASLFNMVSILPVAFIPPRNGFAFFVPLAGWAVYLSVLLTKFRQFVTRGNPDLRAASQAALAAGLFFVVLRPEARMMDLYFYGIVHQEQFRNRDAWNSLRTALPQRLSGKRILALREPFDPGYSLYFMLQLGHNDPTIQVDTARLLAEHSQPVSQALPVLQRGYDYVIDYADGAFRSTGTVPVAGSKGP